MLKVIEIGLTLSVLLTATVGAEDWIIQTVDNEGNAGNGTKLWYDGDGRPNLIYTGTPAIIYHSLWNGAGWTRTIVDTIYSSYTYNLEVISPDTVVLCYAGAGGTPSIRYCTWTSGGSWAKETVATGGHNNLRLAFDSQQTPHVFYPIPEGLIHRFRDSSGIWQSDTDIMLSDIDSLHFDVAINDLGEIYITYRTTQGNLKMAYFDGNTWGTEYIDEDSPSVGAYCRIILDDSDVPHIVYYDATNTQLKYATWQAPLKSGTSER